MPSVVDPGTEDAACPSGDAWLDFLLGRPSEDEQGRLAAHLRVCPECPRVLGRLEGAADDVLAALRRHDAGTSTTDWGPELGRLMAALGTIDPPETVSPAADVGAGGWRIGRFEIVRLIGEGGFGRVFLAIDPTLKRPVAVKVPKGLGPLPRPLRDRWTREGVAASRLDHANIVPVYEAGEAEGIPYIASKYCAGASLAGWLERRPEFLPARLAAGLVATLADAVQHAHDRNVLHRDIKPSNILLDTRGEGGGGAADDLGLGFVPRLADFGLAKLVDELIAGEDGSTQDGTVLGTEEYMAPEQAAGRAREIDARTDVYALGILLYYLLCGRVPFRGETRRETLALIERQEPIPPRRLRPGLPRDLDVICLKCLEKPKHDRYGSASLLADDLRRTLAGEPIRARPPGPTGRAWRWARRHRALSALAAVLVVATPAVGLVLAGANRRLSVALDAAEASNHSMRQRLYAANVNQAWQVWATWDLDRLRELLARCRPEPGSPPSEDFRGFEWHYLEGLASRVSTSERSLRAHAKGVCDVKFAPDGTLLATAGRDGLIKLWDPRTGEARATFAGHEGDVNRIAFAPDGKSLASVGDDRTARLWDLATGRGTILATDRASRLFEVAFAPDGTRLLFGGLHSDIYIWDLFRRRENRLARSPGDLKSLAVDPSGRYFAAAEEDGRIRTWDLSGSPRADIAGPPTLASRDGVYAGGINQIVFAPDGSQLVAAKSDQIVSIWDFRRGGARELLPGHKDRVNCVAFSPDSRFLATGSRDQTIRVWSNDGRPCGVLGGQGADVSALAFSPDGRALVGAGMDGGVRFWNWRERATGIPLLRSLQYMAPSHDSALSPDGQFLAVPDDDREIRVFRTAEGQAAVGFSSAAQEPRSRTTVRANDKPTMRATFSPDGRWLATVDAEGYASLRQPDGRPVGRAFRVAGSGVSALAFSPDGRLLAIAHGTTTRLWDWREGQPSAPLGGRAGEALDLAFSPDGAILAAACGDGALVFWDVATRRVRATRTGHRGAVAGLAFSSDGKTLATGGHDRLVKLWDVEGLRERTTLGGHNDGLGALAFSPDGKTLVSGDRSGTIKLWQAATGLELLSRTEAHSGRVFLLAFQADGRALVAGIWASGSHRYFYRWAIDPRAAVPRE